MKSLNSVQIIGHLGDDPEFKESQGTMIAILSVATSETWLDKKTSEQKKRTEWHKVVCFNNLADIVHRYLKKGSRIYLSGELRTSKWKTDKGEDRSSTEIIAKDLIMLDSKKSHETNG